MERQIRTHPYNNDAISFLKYLTRTPVEKASLLPPVPGLNVIVQPTKVQIGNGKEELLSLDSPTGRLTQVYQDKQFTDISIKFKGTNQIIKAHKLILAMTSTVLEDEILSNPNDDCIFIDDDPVIFDWFLNHAYTGLSRMPDDIDFVIKLYNLLNKYKVFGGAHQCALFLMDKVSFETIDTIYEVGCAYNDRVLTYLCDKFIKENCCKLLKECVDGKRSKVVLLKVLDVLNGKMSEADIFENILKWGKQQADAKHLSLRNVLDKFLEKFSFDSMTTAEILELLVPHELYTSAEIISMLPQSKFKIEKNLLSSCDGRFTQFSDSRMRTCLLSSRSDCRSKNASWLTKEEYLIIRLQSSQNIMLKNVYARKECFPTNCSLKVMLKDQKRGSQSSIGPPWDFWEPIEMFKDVSYSIIVKGHGMIKEHEIAMFSRVLSESLEICGESVVCELSLQFYH